jgi:hypothetical protein
VYGGGGGFDVGTANVIYVNPSSNLDTVYTIIKAKSPTATNRWQINYQPGTYTRTANYLWDASYIDHVGIGNPEDVIITSVLTSGATVTQTSADIRVSNMTMQNTAAHGAGRHGFLIAASTNNNASVYRNLRLLQPNVTKYECYGVFGTSSIGGTWYNCYSSSYGWRCANGMSLTATMYYCESPLGSFQGDNENTAGGTGVLSGNLYHCVGGSESFAGCTAFGANITGYLEDCIGGNFSFAMGKAISGTLIRCTGGTNSFAGWAGGSNTYYGSISGKLTDCVAAGSYSFAQGHASHQITGQLIRCRNNRVGTQINLGNESYTTTFVNTPIIAVTVDSTPTLSDLTVTSVSNDAAFAQKGYIEVAGNITDSIVITATSIASGTVKIQAKSNTHPVSEIKAALDAVAGLNNYLTITVEGDGSGMWVATPGNYYFTETNAGSIINNAGCRKDFKASFSVFPFSNGCTFSNGIATGTITGTLPAAVPGLSFTFADPNDTAGVDLYIDCVGMDNFVKPSGTAMADAEQYQSNNDTFAKVTATCYVTGVWQLENEVGTWVEESP